MVGRTPPRLTPLFGSFSCDENRPSPPQALQEAGCFSLVLECVPKTVAAAVTAAVDIPTIGIGAGNACSGQARARSLVEQLQALNATPEFVSGGRDRSWLLFLLAHRFSFFTTS